VLDAADLAGGHAHDHVADDDEEVVGGRADDGVGAEVARLEPVAADLDDGEEDLGRGGAERHQLERGEVVKEISFWVQVAIS